MKRLFCGLAVLGLLLGAAGQARSDFMYWTDALGGGSIERANLDGSGQITLVGGLNSPNGIVLDLAGGKMFWASRLGGEILRANLDGSELTLLVRGLSSPVVMALDVAGSQMYWTCGTGP